MLTMLLLITPELLNAMVVSGKKGNITQHLLSKTNDFITISKAGVIRAVPKAMNN